MLLEGEVEKVGGISNSAEIERKSEREEEAKKFGNGYVATMMQREVRARVAEFYLP